SRAARCRCGRCHERAGRIARRRILAQRVPADGGVGVWTHLKRSSFKRLPEGKEAGMSTPILATRLYMPRLQTFLLHTSLLDRLSGPLCDAVVLDSTTSGQATLQDLERANLFLIPLDNERHWYRYHHLFAGGISGAASAGETPLYHPSERHHCVYLPGICALRTGDSPADRRRGTLSGRGVRTVWDFSAD